LTKFDFFLEIVCLILLLAGWIFVLSIFSKLPAKIPTHFNLHDEIDAYGNRTFIFLFPILSLVFYLGFTFLQKIPHFYNYPVEITEENAFRQYRLSVQFIRIIKLILLIIFSVSVVEIYGISIEKINGFGIFYVLFIFASIFLTVGVYFFRSKAQK